MANIYSTPLKLQTKEYKKGDVLKFNTFQNEQYLVLELNGFFKESSFILNSYLMTSDGTNIYCHLDEDALDTLFVFDEQKGGKSVSNIEQLKDDFLNKWADLNFFTCIDTSKIPFLKELAELLKGFWWGSGRKLNIDIKGSLTDATKKLIAVQTESGEHPTKEQKQESEWKLNTPLPLLSYEKDIEGIGLDFEYYINLGELPKCITELKTPTLTKKKSWGGSNAETTQQKIEAKLTFLKTVNKEELDKVSEKFEITLHDVIDLLLK